MTAPVVVLVEEPSIRIVIDALCQTLAISSHVQVLEHQGKSDLERSMVRKIRGWRTPVPARFIVSRDLDSAERTKLKAHLWQLVPDDAKPRTKIRIIIPELEAWYLGDPTALVEAELISPQSVARWTKRSRFRDLCQLANAKQEFRKVLSREMGQIAIAHAIGPRLDPARNQCINFRAFVGALDWAVQAVTAPANLSDTQANSNGGDLR